MAMAIVDGITDALKHTTSFAYDAGGRKLELRDRPADTYRQATPTMPTTDSPVMQDAASNKTIYIAADVVGNGQ